MGYGGESAVEDYQADDWLLPPGVCLTTDPTDPSWEAACQLEARAFIARNFAADTDSHALEYEKHLRLSHYLVDENFRGAVRVMLPSAVGFKTINDVHRGRLAVDPAGWELLATLHHEAFVVECNIAVEQMHRSRPFDPQGVTNRLVNAALMYTIQLAAQRNIPADRVYILAGFDEQAFHLFARLYGPAVHRLGPAVDYMGSPTIPTVLFVQEMLDYDQNATRRQMLIYAGGMLLHGR